MAKVTGRKKIQLMGLTQQVAAAGWAGKLGPADLLQVLHSLPSFEHPDVIVGTETSDDAGVFRLGPDLAIVNTVDFFTPVVDDPYTFGQIAAANALSDIYAMGAEPKTALNIVGFPKGKLILDVLADIIHGGSERVSAAGAVVIGGHTIIDEELKYGMAVTGIVHPDRVIRNVGVQKGDALVLTKPLGTGIITTALKRRKASGASVRAAVASMTALNDTASALMQSLPVHACSDVTGFGLLGHSFEMANGSGVTIVLDTHQLPLLPGARRLAEQGYLTGGCRRNRDYLKDQIAVDRSVRHGLMEIALDPQTSGGLLIALPENQAKALVDQLRASGVDAATTVGYATALQDARVRLVWRALARSSSLVAATSGSSERFSFVIAEAEAAGGHAALYRAYTDFSDARVAAPERLHFVISRYSTDAERDTLYSIVSGQGAGKLADAVSNAAAVGWVKWPGGTDYTLRYARAVPRPDGGQDLVLIADRRMWTWWLPGSASSETDPFTVIQVRLNGQSVGEGRLSLGGTIAASKEMGVMLKDYAGQPALLADVRREKEMKDTDS